nr:TniQ family protein [uncultured Pseudomonas sp.]
MNFSRSMPHILYDETISSWLFRSTLKSRSKLQVETDQFLANPPPVSWGSHLLECEDWDFDPNTGLSETVIEKLSINPAHAYNVFFKKREKIVGWNRRWWFCALCLRADIAKGHTPGWRKNWCYRNSIICTIHGVDLQRLLITPQLSRAWDAFLQSLKSGRLDESWSCKYHLRFRTSIVSRLANWKRKQSVVVIDVFDSLYDIFLLAPVYNDNQGMALDMFGKTIPFVRNKMSNYHNGILYGAELAGCKARFASLMLAGYLMGVIGEQDFEFAENKSAELKIWRSYNPEIIRAIKFGCASAADYRLLESHLAGYRDLGYIRLIRAVDDYLSGY